MNLLSQFFPIFASAKIRVVVFSLFSVMDVLITEAQPYCVSYEANSPRVGDKICRRQVPFSPPTDGGEGQCWAVPRAEGPYRGSIAIVTNDSASTTLSFVGPQDMRHYKQAGDTLLLTGIETPLKHICFKSALPCMIYPMVYGKSFSVPFQGEGLYCKRQKVKTNGCLIAETDAAGSLVFEDGDTLHHVLRLHTLMTSTITVLEEDSVCVDSMVSLPLIQEREERYLWFARGYRYPVYEAVSFSSYHDGALVSSLQSAYRYIADDSSLFPDSVNAEIQKNDSLQGMNAENCITYSLEKRGQVIHLQYDLKVPAKVSALLCNAMGMVYRQASGEHESGEGYQMDIDCSGLYRGHYVLYLNVNGQIYNETISITDDD